MPPQQRVHRVARRPRHRAHDRALFAQQPIEQRGLSDVRAPHDRDGHFEVRFRRGTSVAPLGQSGDDFVEQVRHALAVLRRNLEDRVEPEAVELERAPARAAIVRFVDREDDGAVRAAEGGGDLLVGRQQPVAAIHDEHEDIGRFDRTAAVGDDQIVERILARPEHPAGIDEGERSTLPFGGLRDDVPGRARDWRHDRATGAGDSIEHGRLPDVRPADQHDHRTTRRVLQGHGRSSVRTVLDSVSDGGYAI